MSKPIIGVERFDGEFHATLKMGNQTFFIRPLRSGEDSSERDARWQAEMLMSAFGIPRIGDVPEVVPSVHLPNPLKP